MNPQSGKIVAVVGDVHHHIGLAAEGLDRIEAEFGCPVDQVFSVGDLGLFLHETDWEFLTGPKKYRRPEDSPRILEAWKNWRWPLSMIAGNHEPFHRLRNWQPDYFFHKLEYTDAGELQHCVAGMRVAGLSGIYHPDGEEFMSALESRTMKIPHVESWPEMVPLAGAGRISRSRLTYHKGFEVERMKRLGFRPDLLLLHDWPIPPQRIQQVYARRPEHEIVMACDAPFVCCGHHHTAARFRCGASEVIALNIISTPEGIHQHRINEGWCALFRWHAGSLEFLQTWPE